MLLFYVLLSYFFAVEWPRCVPDRDEQQVILKKTHVGAEGTLRSTTGHMGSRSLFHVLAPKFYWPRMSEDCKQFTLYCIDCQRANDVILNKVPQEMHPVGIPFGQQWTQLGIDLMKMPPAEGPDGQEYTQCMTVIDYFTKWVEMFPLKRKTEIEVAENMWRCVLRFGCAATHITDQGKEFCNGVADELYRLTGTQHRCTSAYHPQANGLVERTNRHHGQMLRTAISTQLAQLASQEDWVKYLPSIASSINTHQSQSTGFTPFEMMFGRKYVYPHEKTHTIPIGPDGKQDTLMTVRETNRLIDLHTEEHIMHHMTTMEGARAEIYKKAEKNILAAQKRQKRNFDRRHCGGLTLSVGEKCWVLNKKNDDRKGGKLETRWLGPYEVYDVDYNKSLYIVKDLKTGKVRKRKVPVNQIKKYLEKIPSAAWKTHGSPDDELSGVSEEPVRKKRKTELREEDWGELLDINMEANHEAASVSVVTKPIPTPRRRKRPATATQSKPPADESPDDFSDLATPLADRLDAAKSLLELATSPPKPSLSDVIAAEASASVSGVPKGVQGSSLPVVTPDTVSASVSGVPLFDEKEDILPDTAPMQPPPVPKPRAPKKKEDGRAGAEKESVVREHVGGMDYWFPDRTEPWKFLPRDDDEAFDDELVITQVTPGYIPVFRPLPPAEIMQICLRDKWCVSPEQIRREHNFS